jgi:hypothetical protein
MAVRSAQSDQSWALPMAFRSSSGGRRCKRSPGATVPTRPTSRTMPARLASSHRQLVVTRRWFGSLRCPSWTPAWTASTWDSKLGPAAPTPDSRGLHAPERCARRRSHRSQASVRAAISWTSRVLGRVRRGAAGRGRRSRRGCRAPPRRTGRPGPGAASPHSACPDRSDRHPRSPW